ERQIGRALKQTSQQAGSAEAGARTLRFDLGPGPVSGEPSALVAKVQGRMMQNAAAHGRTQIDRVVIAVGDQRLVLEVAADGTVKETLR
ncbi:MAG: hypothetical protein ACLFU2_14095, partial [Opitutales bacterium]